MAAARMARQYGRLCWPRLPSPSGDASHEWDPASFPPSAAASSPSPGGNFVELQCRRCRADHAHRLETDVSRHVGSARSGTAPIDIIVFTGISLAMQKDLQVTLPGALLNDIRKRSAPDHPSRTPPWIGRMTSPAASASPKPPELRSASCNPPKRFAAH